MTKFVPLLAIVAMSLGLVSVVHAQADTVTFDPDMVTRAVDENSGADQNVGSPVTAAYTGTGTLTYTLGGTDAASFAIDSSTGQIKTREGVTYDHEAKSSYTVTVTASDGSGGTDDATVTINVNDVDEPPLAPAKPLTIPTPGTYYSVEVRWTPPDNTGRPHITGYDVHYSGGSGHRGTVSVTGNSVTLTGLVPVNIRYDIRVRANNEEGNGTWSEIAEEVANGPPYLLDPGDPIIPSGLGRGDVFRLLFVTTHDNDKADTTDYSEYFNRGLQDVFVTRFNGLVECGCPRPVVSTRHYDARSYTDSLYTDDDRGVPIYWVGGGRVAADYADFYDGEWENETNPTDVQGRPHPLPVGPWTGSAANTEVRPLYVLTAPLEVGFPLLVSNFTQYDAFGSDLSAGRSQRFSTGGNRHGYELGLINLHYGDFEGDSVSAAVYTVNQEGHLETLVATLNPPGLFHRATIGIPHAPEDTVLAANTTYAVVVRPVTPGTDVRLGVTDAVGGDILGLDDWSIGHAFDIESGGSWEADSDGRKLYMEIRGALRVVPPSGHPDLSATAVGRDRIDLSWNAPTDDGGSAINGYRIESSADGSTGWADLVGDTSSTATTYSDTGLMANTTRHYRVSAINGEGTSDPSSSANATTDYPDVTVQFETDSYTVAEGGTQSVTVTLSEDPLQTTVIPLTPTNQGDATAGDYTVPPSVTFNSGDTSKALDFMATQDTEDDDDESVKLGFGANLPSKVSIGTMDETTVNITDDDDPIVRVMFAQASYLVLEGDTIPVRVTLSANPERQVIIPITATAQGTTTAADYSVMQSSVTFNEGETSKTIEFTAKADSEDDDGESVRLAIGGTLPSRVSAGMPSQTTVTITSDCGDVDIWCATLQFNKSTFGGSERLNLSQIDTKDFHYDGVDYQLIHIRVIQNGHSGGDDVNIRWPFGIPERTKWSMDFRNLNSGTGSEQFEILTEDWRDWTLHVSTVSDGETLTAALRFSESRYTGEAWWWWYGRDIDHLRRVWKPGQLYKLRLVMDPRAERTPQPLNPPLYLHHKGVVNTDQVYLRWLAPQTWDDQVPLVDSYKIQWKQSSGSWDVAADVTETISGPSSQRVNGHFLGGLTPGTKYNIRVIATDSVGDSEPSNEITYTMPAAAEQSLSNTPAEGEPRIDGTPEAGQTLSADTTGITDDDGLEHVVFQYRWLADGAVIDGATGSTYTLTSDDEGRAITVRVDFTDDAGNDESLTSASVVVTAGLELQSATVNGATLTLTYNEILDNLVRPPEDAFAVNVNGESRTPMGVAVGQSNVLLLLSQAVAAGDTVTVDYTAPDGANGIQDTQGRKADSFTGQAVTNNTDVADAGRSDSAQTPGSPQSLEVVRHESGKLKASWDAPDLDSAPIGYTVQWKESGDDWEAQDAVSEANVKGTSHVITGLTDGVQYAVRGIAYNDDAESAPSGEVIATPRETEPPAPSSASVDGATLTITFDEPLDPGETPDRSAFAATVAGAGRGVETIAVSGSGVTITLVTAVFAGDAVTVDYTAPTGESAAKLQDTVGNAAASFNGHQVANNTQEAAPLTAGVHDVPASHDGNAVFTFELRFSEQFPLSYKTLRDHAFTVTGGEVTGARRLERPGNIRWEITVRPSSDAAVTIVLPVTEDCDADGAICTEDARQLSNRLEIAVPGPEG